MTSYECRSKKDKASKYVEKNTFLMSVDTPSSITMKMKVNKIASYKISGLWDWAIEYSPDRRMRHLIKYGKSKRVQLKNFKRTFKKIVGSSIHEWTDWIV